MAPIVTAKGVESNPILQSVGQVVDGDVLQGSVFPPLVARDMSPLHGRIHHADKQEELTVANGSVFLNHNTPGSVVGLAQGNAKEAQTVGFRDDGSQIGQHVVGGPAQVSAASPHGVELTE
jgi:hypothetical protein